jgi:hypothetical protein
VASIAAWLLCRWSGYAVAAWVAPLTISTFCLGLFLGIACTTKDRIRVPLLAHHAHNPHLAHHSVMVELHSDFERVRSQLKTVLSSARTP